MLGLVMFLLFTLIPAIETYLIVKIGSVIGAGETVFYLVTAGFVGAWLGKRAGMSILKEMFMDLERGIYPGDKVVEGLLVLVAAVLLITPGYLTDFMGLLLFMDPVRQLLAPLVKKIALSYLMPRVQSGMGPKGGVWFGNFGPGPAMRERGFAQHPPEGQPHEADKKHPTFKHPTV